jgi:hypothetical protein
LKIAIFNIGPCHDRSCSIDWNVDTVLSHFCFDPKERRAVLALECTAARITPTIAASSRRELDYGVTIGQQLREIAIGIDELLK